MVILLFILWVLYSCATTSVVYHFLVPLPDYEINNYLAIFAVIGGLPIVMAMCSYQKPELISGSNIIKKRLLLTKCFWKHINAFSEDELDTVVYGLRVDDDYEVDD